MDPNGSSRAFHGGDLPLYSVSHPIVCHILLSFFSESCEDLLGQGIATAVAANQLGEFLQNNSTKYCEQRDA